MFNTPFTYFDQQETVNAVLFYGTFPTFDGVTYNGIYATQRGSLRAGIPNFNTGTGFNLIGVRAEDALISAGRKPVFVGYFTTFNGITVNRVVRLNPDGSRDTTFNTGTGFNAQVRAVVSDGNGGYFMGGNFTTYKGASVNRIIKIDANGNRDLSFTPVTTNNQVLDLQFDGSRLYVVGDFTSPTNRIMALNLDGSRDTSFNVGTGLNTLVIDVNKHSDGSIIAVGQFTTYKGVSANGIVKILPNGDRDTSFNIGTGFSRISAGFQVFTTLEHSDGTIFVGGRFDTYKGVSVPKLLRLNLDGSVDNTFTFGTIADVANPGVFSLSRAFDGGLNVGGDWNTYDGIAHRYYVRLKPNNTLDTNFMGAAPTFEGVGSVSVVQPF
jgi:hypothetical protein